MKTERRHELQTNKLADWLGKQIDALRPYSKAITWGVLALLVAGFAALFLLNQQRSGRSAAWRDYLNAGSDSAILRDVASRYEGTVPGLWAKQTLADAELMQGTMLLFRDRDEAESALETAKENYEEVIASAGRHKMLLRHAKFGLAQTYESMNELEKAKELYQELVDGAPQGALAGEARRRLERMAQLESDRFYNWFANQTPTPVDSLSPETSGSSGSLPLDLSNLPDHPDLKFPGSGATTGQSTPESTTPESTTPESATPESTVPQPGTPEPGTPESTTPESTSPESTTPESTAPESTSESATPESTPESATPESTSESTAPESATPQSTTQEPSSNQQPAAASGDQGDGGAA